MKLPSNVIIAELFIMFGVGWLALKRFVSSEVCQTWRISNTNADPYTSTLRRHLCAFVVHKIRLRLAGNYARG